MPGLRRSTLADVARRAGVSRTTASYILNGRSAQMRISAATEERVQQAMRELDYHPNWNARTLRRSHTQTIGFVADFVARGAYAGELLHGASSAARAWDHLMVVGETLGDAATESLLVEEMVQRQVDGVVYASLDTREVSLPERLRTTGRVVLLNCEDPSSSAPCVLPDDEDAGRQAAAYLLERSVVGPVVVVGDDGEAGATAGPRRRAGLVAGLVGDGRRPVDEIRCAWEALAARRAVASYLSEGGRPVAVVCMNDRVAMGTYQALGDAGLEAGVDVSVVAFEGSELATWLRPALTTLTLPFRQMGTWAVEALMRPERRSSRRVMLPLVLREAASVVPGPRHSPVQK